MQLSLKFIDFSFIGVWVIEWFPWAFEVIMNEIIGRKSEHSATLFTNQDRPNLYGLLLVMLLDPKSLKSRSFLPHQKMNLQVRDPEFSAQYTPPNVLSSGCMLNLSPWSHIIIRSRSWVRAFEHRYFRAISTFLFLSHKQSWGKPYCCEKHQSKMYQSKKK